MTTIAGLLLSFAILATNVAGEDLARRVLVVYNETEPESKPLAEYYAQRRGIPTNQICALHVRNAETITRQEFNTHIREPLRNFMTDRELWMQLPATGANRETIQNKITFIALIYGVPLRIQNDPNCRDGAKGSAPPIDQNRNEAAVDSELTWLPSTIPLNSATPNPFFSKSTAVFDDQLNRAMVLVTRLDGPDAKTVRRMIDDSIAVERTGLLGCAYFDAQNKQEAYYEAGDKWIVAAAQFARDAGFETVLDTKPALFGEDYPMADAAMYAGWYAANCTGSFTRADFKFRPGAVAYHLHSWSAMSVRSRTTGWVGPFLARGAAASFGNVYEPYLEGTPRVDLFFKRLLAGATFAEAGWYSEPAVSWQTTFVGDPLYRPFALTLDGQIARLEANGDPNVAWAYLRKINILLNAGEFDAAQKLCAEKAASTRSPILADKLATLQKKN